MDNYFIDAKLAKTPPIKRAAYSDRTAWIMAELSRLVYEPLPCEVSVDTLIEKVKNAIETGEYDTVTEVLLKNAIQSGLSLSSETEKVLSNSDFELVDSFATDGTEALLAMLKPNGDFEGMLILAFRGTQPSIKDVVTDMKAKLTKVPDSDTEKVHAGFYEAFGKVRTKIDDAIKKHESLPLYITGHSLGGALAMIATRYLGSDSTGATYTYGCPRVANDAFYKNIKTPVYRIVNASDIVPRVPFGAGLAVFLALIRLLPVNGTRKMSEWIRKMIGGYTHHGNLIFMDHVHDDKDEDGISYKDLKVVHSPNIFWRTSTVMKRYAMTFGRAAVDDHSMDSYSAKLLAHTQRRDKL